MKINGLYYLLLGGILGALMAVMFMNVNEITAKEPSPRGSASASFIVPQTPVPTMHPIDTKKALCWVNGFRDFNQTLTKPFMAPITSIPNVCPTVDSVPTSEVHSWFIGEDELKALLKLSQAGAPDPFSGIRIYPALRNQPYKIGQNQGLLENAMTLVICPTFEKGGTHDNQYNIVAGDTNIVAFEYLASCPILCPKETLGKLDLARDNYPQTNCAEPCQ
jgi:hypothetical protein